MSASKKEIWLDRVVIDELVDALREGGLRTLVEFRNARSDVMDLQCVDHRAGSVGSACTTA